jgi:hypothetical protein
MCKKLDARQTISQCGGSQQRGDEDGNVVLHLDGACHCTECGAAPSHDLEEISEQTAVVLRQLIRECGFRINALGNNGAVLSHRGPLRATCRVTWNPGSAHSPIAGLSASFLSENNPLPLEVEQPLRWLLSNDFELTARFVAHLNRHVVHLHKLIESSDNTLPGYLEVRFIWMPAESNSNLN